MNLKHNVQDADSHFIFNPATRGWTYKPTKKRVLIQGDHNSEVFTFEFPRFIEGHDMSQCDAVQVHYINIDDVTREQSCGVYEVNDVQALTGDPDTLTCSWLISNNATKYRGGLSFLLRFACFREDGTVDYDWHSAIFSGVVVAKGINNGDVIVAEYPDILAQWRQDIDRLEAVDWMATKEVIHVGSVILADQTKTFGGSPTIISGLQMEIDPGVYYDVTWNGKVYSCQALVYDGETYLGNGRVAFGSAASELPDTGEPFGIVYTGGAGIMLTKANSATETITLSIATQTVVKYNKLPAEYLPDNIGGGGGTSIDVTAEVGQTIIVKEVDANGKPTKWEAADHQPKICGAVETLLVYEATVEVDDEGLGFFTPTFDIVEGNSYRVTINGIPTIIKAIAMEGVVGIIDMANGIILAHGRDFADDDSLMVIVAPYPSQTITLSVVETVISPIPQKYMVNAFPYYIEVTGSGTKDDPYVCNDTVANVEAILTSGREVKLKVTAYNSNTTDGSVLTTTGYYSLVQTFALVGSASAMLFTAAGQGMAGNAYLVLHPQEDGTYLVDQNLGN